MIEAELKARLTRPDDLRRHLAARATAERATCHDTYFDNRERELTHSDRELRLRTKSVGTHTRHLLTYKEPAVDQATGSKPEHETVVAGRQAVEAMLEGLGYVPVIAFTKQCENYTFEHHGRQVLATVATVPELDDTFLEVETQVDEHDLDTALDDLRQLLAVLGVEANELTTELYTEAVAARRDAPSVEGGGVGV